MTFAKGSLNTHAHLYTCGINPTPPSDSAKSVSPRNVCSVLLLLSSSTGVGHRREKHPNESINAFTIQEQRIRHDTRVRTHAHTRVIHKYSWHSIVFQDVFARACVCVRSHSGNAGWHFNGNEIEITRIFSVPRARRLVFHARHCFIDPDATTATTTTTTVSLTGTLVKTLRN